MFLLTINLGVAIASILRVARGQTDYGTNSFVTPPNWDSTATPRSYSADGMIPFEFYTEWSVVCIGIYQGFEPPSTAPYSDIHFWPNTFETESGHMHGNWTFDPDGSEFLPPAQFDLSDTECTYYIQ